MTNIAQSITDKAGKHYRLTLRQEDFARAYVETDNASEAYRRAYPGSRKWKATAVTSRASDLLAHQNVMGTVDRLRAGIAKRHETTVDSLTVGLRSAGTLAHTNGQAGAAVQAVMGEAKLHGLLVDKHEDVTQPDDMSPAELSAHLAELDRKLIAAMPEADLVAHEAYLKGHLSDTTAELARRTFKVVGDS